MIKLLKTIGKYILKIIGYILLYAVFFTLLKYVLLKDGFEHTVLLALSLIWVNTIINQK